MVSKKHRITAAYAPKNPTGAYHLDASTAAALAKMTAAARADGVRIRVRSGYRNWATQNASYQRAKRNYPQNLSFYAPAGASEHQTGLAVDLWDGVTWSLPMANTATGKWLFKHAHEYGFVLRYPERQEEDHRLPLRAVALPLHRQGRRDEVQGQLPHPRGVPRPRLSRRASSRDFAVYRASGTGTRTEWRHDQRRSGAADRAASAPASGSAS